MPVKDTIPSSLKKFFFAGRQAPDLLKQYDVIGFTVENCLVKYNIVDLTATIVRDLLDKFHKKGYHERVKFFDYRKHLSLALNGGVWDIKHGTIIRLAEGCVVTHAIRGYNKLTIQEI